MLPYKSSSLVHPLLSLTHWIFGSLMLPYKSSSLVQNVFAVHRFARGGRRLAVRKMIECHISAQPRTPFPASRDFPSRGNEGSEEKNSESYTSCTIPVFPPFGGWRHHLSPASGGTITRAYCRAAYEESVSRCFILPPEQGQSGAAGKGEASAASQSAECLSCHMVLTVNPVTLTL